MRYCILASNSSVFNNTTGLHTGNGGALYSYGTNRVNGNVTTARSPARSACNSSRVSASHYQ
jgi:hypothetical protein